MRFLAYSLLLCLSASPIHGQIAGLTAPGNGTDLYYSLSPGPIYRIGSVPATLFRSVPPPVFPAPPAQFENPFYISPYYQTSQPQFSRDRHVFAYTAGRVCLGGQGCVNRALYQTTVQTESGAAEQTFPGIGWISGNGRYLLTRQVFFAVPGGLAPVVTDLQTGRQQSIPAPFSEGTEDDIRTGSTVCGRIVADDGTAVLAMSSAIFVFRDGRLIQISQPASTVAEPVIDAAARTVLYTTAPIGGQRYLRVYDIPSAQDRVYVQPNGDTYSPAISADDRRVMFLSAAQWGTKNPPGVVQLYAMNLDGKDYRQLTSSIEPAGVRTYVMSDDGQTAWYISNLGELVRLELAGPQPLRTAFHPALIDLSAPLVPGSAIKLNGPPLSADVRVLWNGAPAPVLSVSQDAVVSQLPWEAQVGQPGLLEVIVNAGNNAERTVKATISPVVSAPSLLTCTEPGCWPATGGAAIHEDWSAFVSPGRPAQPGETLHFYGAGLGPVQPPVPTGAISPGNPPAMLTSRPTCTLDPGLGDVTVVWAGLAPGFTGYYQMDIRLPSKLVPPVSFLYPTSYPIAHLDCGLGITADFAVAK
jgi:uncharacterized protein (TIGR03437 family)